MLIEKKFNAQIIKSLASGGIGIIPTDTIYGIVGSALSPKTVLKIYRIRKRNLKKPMIILVPNISSLQKFGIKPDRKTRALLAKLWPGKNSVILKSDSKKFKYLSRGSGSLAFRLPKNRVLRNFLSKTGPLVAPSANPEGLPPAKNIKEAQDYFGEKLDFYVDIGRLEAKPSRVIKIEDGKKIIIRK